MTRLVILLAALLVALPARGAEEPQSIEAVLARAVAAQREGAATIESDRAAGEALLRESIAAYRAALDSGIDNPALRYNIGNARAALGDNGRALASYLRAERMAPRDADIRANREAVRSRIASPIEPSLTTRTIEVVAGGFGVLSARERMWVFALAWALLWIAVAAPALGLRPPRGARRAAVAAAGLVAAVTAMSLGAAWWLGAERPLAVLVERSPGLLGPDERAYESAFAEPLPAGVVGRAIDARPGWARLRLRDGRDAWFSDRGLEWVDSPPVRRDGAVSARPDPSGDDGARSEAARRPTL